MKLKKLAITLAVAGAAYIPAAQAQIIDYSVCKGNANYYRDYDNQRMGEFQVPKSLGHYQEQVDSLRKAANKIILENNRMVSKGGTRWQYYLDSGLGKVYGKPNIKLWGNGGKEYHYTFLPYTDKSPEGDKNRFKCPTLSKKAQASDGVVTLPVLEEDGAPASSIKPYIWDEARYFIDSNGKVVGWLESFRGTQLCESAPTPCGLNGNGALTKEERERVEGLASEAANELVQWIGYTEQDLIKNAKLKLIGKPSDGNGGKIYEYGYKDINNRNNPDYSQVSRYFVGRDGIIYGYGGWLNFGDVPICAGGGNLGACGQGGRVLFKKNVSPQQLRRDGK